MQISNQRINEIRKKTQSQTFLWCAICLEKPATVMDSNGVYNLAVKKNILAWKQNWQSFSTYLTSFLKIF